MKRLFLLVSLAVGLVQSIQADSVVVFNEIMYHPATNEPAMEWVELRNLLAADVDLSGWELTGALNYTFASNTIVRGGGFVVVASSPAALSAATGLVNIFGPLTNRLGNNGDTLRLRNNSGRVMDEVTYGADGDWPVAPDGSGVSLAKRDPDSASEPAENWTSSEQMGGTPGLRNFAPPGFNGPPGLISYWAFNETLGTYVGDATRANFGTSASGVTRVNSGSGRALSFNGTTNAFVNVGAGSTFNVGDGITVEAVLQPGWSGNGSAVIFRKAPRRPPAYRDAVLTNNPIAYWRLGDATTTIADSSPSNRVGIATAGVLLNQPGLIASDPGNGAARFTGAERITVNGFEKIGATGYTVEYWVRPQVLPANCCQNLVGDGEAAGDYFMMNYLLGPLQGATGGIRPHYGPGNSPVSMNSAGVLQVNNTYHVVTTWDTGPAANNAVIYINGVADQVGTISRNVPAPGTTGNNRVYIGKDDRDTTDGTEIIDEVALYNRPLSAADVAAHYVAGITANFDVNLGNAIQLAFQNDGSNGAAIPPVPAGQVLSFGVTVGGTYSELDMPLDGAAGRPTLAALENGQPHHVAATFDSASGLKAIYLDGVLRFSTTIGGGLNGTNFGTAVLGNSETNGTAPFVGTLDEMAYWGRALSASEVTAHWTALQAGRDYFTPAAVGSAATVAFNEFSATTNADFWIELANYGTNPVPMTGFVLQRDGAGSADGEYVFPAGVSIPSGGFLVVSNSTLGFHPVDGDRLFLLPPARDKVLDALVLTKGPRARLPVGTGPLLRPGTVTPGGANSFALHNEIVINEIMYNHALLPGTNNLPVESPEAWIELYNRSANPVDLTGWELGAGIRYLFTPGQTIPAGGYLVVADDAAYLRALYPNITVVGNFEGRLSGQSDRIVLKDPSGNTADEVRYFDRAPWPEYADGGGSSLELTDARLDNSKPEAWADSYEGGKSSWMNVSYRMVAGIPSGNGQPTVWADFILGLLGPGECLIDDISVIEAPAGTPVQLISNGGFDSGLSGWRVLGTHGESYLDVDPQSPGNPVLHVVATGPQEHMHNHIERTLNNQRLPQNGLEYQISYRVKWVAGNNLLNTRLYFNRCARTTALPMPALNGTPGAPNASPSGGGIPTFASLAHDPVVPQPGEPVTVSVMAQHFGGAPTCQLFWSVDSGPANSVAMVNAGDGRYTAAISGQTAGAVVQFWIRGERGGVSAFYPADGSASGALYQVADGQAILNAGHNMRIIVTPANRDTLQDLDVTGLRSTNVMSNARIPGTLVYDERRAYYNVGVRLKGSQRGRANRDRISYHLEFPPDDLFRGVHPFMLLDRSGAGDATANKQQEILIKQILLRAGDIPSTQPDLCRVIAPRTAMTGSAILSPRLEDNFVDTAFDDGGDGGMWELELIYYLNAGQTNQFGYKFVQQPPPNNDSVTSTDISDVGNDEETYRYNFMIKMHRDADNYAPFLNFAKTWSLPSGPALDSQTRNVMDVDEWMRVWALVTLCGVGDTYTFGNNHNLFMYLRPSDQKMLAFPADMDFSFNRAATAALVGDQNLSKILSLPANLRSFYAHILDIINVSYNPSYITYWVNHYQNLISPPQSYTPVISYIQQRSAFAISTINAQAGTAFTVNGSTLITTNNNLLTFTGTAAAQIKTIRVNGVEYPVTWTTVATWSLRVPVNGASNVLNIVGYDLHGNPLTNFSRTITNIYTGPLPDPRGSIVFNELMFSPAAPGGAFVELINNAGAAFDISGYQINGLDYTFPNGSIITSGQCLALAADLKAFSNYGTNAFAYAQFDGRLDPDGETLTLIKPGTNGAPDLVIDKIRYESRAPWPAGAGTNSVQLLAAGQDNTRPSNWTDREDWRLVTYTGTISGGASLGTNFLLFLFTAGETYVDDLVLVTGTQAGVGPNLLLNGDFESPLSGPWTILGSHSNSVISTEFSHSGSASLRIVAAGAGSATSAIRQFITPFAGNTVCTLSFWLKPVTNAQQVVMRTTPGSSFTSVNSARLSPFTPGIANSVAAPLIGYDPLWLNELQADNLTGPLDNAGQREPWIELHNSGESPIDLSAYYLANNYDTNLTQWRFPDGSAIAPGEFKVIWADGQAGQSSGANLHASFRLNSTTGSVALVRIVDTKPQITDYLTYSALIPDRSYGDYPDGQIVERRQFFRPTPGAANDPAPPPIQVYINEWMAQNTSGLINTNNSNRRNDWFELYNPGDAPAVLDGYFLTDNLADKFRFPIPAGRVIPAHGYLFVWADGEPGLNTNTDSALHVSFSLDQDGDQIGLFAADGTRIDAVDFAAESQFANVSEGRFPNGSTNIYFLAQATPLGPNSTWANRYPSLAEIPDALVLPGESLAFVAHATDPDLPVQSFTFSIDNSAPIGAEVDAVSGQFNWTPSPAQSPSTNFLTLRVTDSGTPALTAARTFTVVVKPGVRITGVVLQQGGSIGFSVGTIPGKTYRVEYKESLDALEWTPLGADQVVNATTLTVTDNIGPDRQRFYRVVQVN